ncbi:Probable calcium-binding protein CML18 (Calmodulin-like protein 18) [Durusdinium trenchii]|uniref:Probable calcium-binding protein CML18 (Calmodulin-like protein 18) n=1 Tax=Durusdinium trenchii TaxID=1381693 RepID=A0ABP0KIE7_9DINO
MPPDLSGLLLSSFAQAHRYVRLPARTGPSKVEESSKDSEKIKDIFRKYDLNNDGCISHEELWEVLSKLCPSLTRSEVERLFVKMDANRDQRIQSSEFVDFLFGFADLSDKAEMQMRDAAASSTAAPEGEKYRPSSCEPETLPEEPDLRLKKNDSVLSTFTLDIQGEEPDLSELLERLQQMNAQALREVFQKADVNKKGFLKLNQIRTVLFPANVQTEDQQLAVVKVFAQMDKNSDGKIHCGEFVSYILEGKRRASRSATASDKRQMACAFASADAETWLLDDWSMEDDSGADGAGAVGKSTGPLLFAKAFTLVVNAFRWVSPVQLDFASGRWEFEHLFGAQTDFDRQMLRQTFAKVDRNQDGAVSLVELAELYGKEPTFRTGRVGGDRSKGFGPIRPLVQDIHSQLSEVLQAWATGADTRSQRHHSVGLHGCRLVEMGAQDNP